MFSDRTRTQAFRRCSYYSMTLFTSESESESEIEYEYEYEYEYEIRDWRCPTRRRMLLRRGLSFLLRFGNQLHPKPSRLHVETEWLAK